MIYRLYFNGEIYYVSSDSHYKHGNALMVSFDEEELRKERDRLQNKFNERNPV
jgi:hypothetical protein